jgi:hypothetical protein
MGTIDNTVSRQSYQKTNFIREVFIMSKSLYFKSVVMAMILCVISFSAVSAQDQPSDKPLPPQEKPSTESVLVEAYLVQVSNAVLAGAGTALLPGEDKESVSITKLLWCMKDPNGGKVVSMGRAFCRTKETAKSSNTKTVYVAQTTTQVPTAGSALQSVTYQSYDSRNEIDVNPYINENGTIVLGLNFVYAGFTESKADEGRQAPPGKFGYNFNSMLTIKPNQPMIVGGMQSGDSSLFLIVRAEVVK